jgi:hypothetical protein
VCILTKGKGAVRKTSADRNKKQMTTRPRLGAWIILRMCNRVVVAAFGREKDDPWRVACTAADIGRTEVLLIVDPWGI